MRKVGDIVNWLAVNGVRSGSIVEKSQEDGYWIVQITGYDKVMLVHEKSML